MDDNLVLKIKTTAIELASLANLAGRKGLIVDLSFSSVDVESVDGVVAVWESDVSVFKEL